MYTLREETDRFGDMQRPVALFKIIATHRRHTGRDLRMIELWDLIKSHADQEGHSSLGYKSSDLAYEHPTGQYSLDIHNLFDRGYLNRGPENTLLLSNVLLQIADTITLPRSLCQLADYVIAHSHGTHA